MVADLKCLGCNESARRGRPALRSKFVVFIILFQGDKRNVIVRSIFSRSLMSSLFFVLILSGAMFAQSNGSLRGKVTDPTGAVIPGAVVTAKSSVGQSGSATSGGDGSYAINGLAPGQYSVSVSA